MTKQDSMTKKTDAELSKLLAETREQLRTERFVAAGSRPKDPSAHGKFRRTIARILTEQHARTAKSA